MSKPPSNQLVARFLNGHIHKIVFGSDESEPDTWPYLVDSWNIKKHEPWKQYGLTFYASTPPPGSDGEHRFELHCKNCLDNKCSISKLQKPTQFSSFAGSTNFTEDLYPQPWKHSNVNPNFHSPDCACWEDRMGNSNPNSHPSNIRQKNFLVDVEYEIEPRPPLLPLSGKIKLNYFGDTVSNEKLRELFLDKLREMESNEIISDINDNSDNRKFECNFRILSLPRHISVSVNAGNIGVPGDPTFHILFTKNPHWNNLRFWRKKQLLQILTPIPLLGKDPEKISLQDSENSSYTYLININDDFKIDINTVSKQSIAIGDLSKEHPLGTHVHIIKESDLRAELSQLSDIAENLGIGLIRKNLIQIELMELEQNSNFNDITHILSMNNNTGEDAKVEINFLPFGAGRTQFERNMSDIEFTDVNIIKEGYIFGIKPQDRPIVKKNSTEVVFLKLIGRGELQCKQLPYSQDIRNSISEMIMVRNCRGRDIIDKHSIEIVKINLKDKNPEQISEILRELFRISGIQKLDDWKHPEE